MKSIPITKVNFGDEEARAVMEVLSSGWIVQGPRVAEFERRFAEFLGVENAVATSSGTTALHLALLAAGVGPGDDVLVPSFTFVATANAVEYTGARPVLVDINPNTFTMDPHAVASYMETCDKAPRAIIPVSQFGLCADMTAITWLAEKGGMLVIEDAACGFGAKREGRFAGTEAAMGTFSFHPRKTITTGEGGMIITGDVTLAESIRRMRNHGASASDLERHVREGGSLLPNFDQLGHNARMTDMQGALGVVQMDRAEEMLAERREAAARYDDLLADVPKLVTPRVPEGYKHAYQSYVCLYGLDPAMLADGGEVDWDQIDAWNLERNRLMAALEKEGISTRQGTHAVHTLGYYRERHGYGDRDLPMAFLADRLSIALPLYAGITPEDQKRVVEGLKSLLR